MIDPKHINEFVSDVLDALPDGLKNMPKDIQDNLRIAMKSTFEKMDLVTREEFDAQTKVLQRTREKLEAIEKKLDAMEK